jgi:hypothetical protein
LDTTFTRSWIASRSRRLALNGAREYLLGALVIALLTLGFFNPIFRAHGTFSDVAGHQTAIYPWLAYTPPPFTDAYPQSDQADTFYPWQVALSSSLRDGDLPLWNPYSFGGVPFLTNGASGALYPPRVLLALLVSPSWAHDLFLIIHVFLSGFAMFALLKEFRTGFIAAVFAGLAWMFSSYNFAWIQLEHPMVVAAWLPVAVLFARRAVIHRSVASAVGAATALALCALGTVALYAASVYAVAIGYAVLLAVRQFLVERVQADREWRLFLYPSLIGILAAGIPAATLLPTFLASRLSGREPPSYEEFTEAWAVPPRVFLNTFRPPPTPVTAETMHEMAFVGTLAACFAIIGALRRSPGAGLGRSVAIITFLVTIGTPVAWVAYHLLPGFAYVRPLGRWLFLWCFAVVLLAALGIDGMMRWAKRPSLGPFGRLAGGRVRARANGMLRSHAAALGAVALVLGVGTTVLAAFQVIPYARKINPPFQPRERRYLYPETPAIAALERDKESRGPEARQRIMPIRRSPIGVPWTPPTMYASHSMMFQIESAAGYESLLPDRTAAIWRVVAGETPNNVLRLPLDGAYLPSFVVRYTRFDLLPRLGVTTLYTPPDVLDDPTWSRTRYAPLKLQQVYAGPDGRVLDLLGSQPRAYVVHRVEQVSGEHEALVRFTDPAFDFRKRLLLEPSESRKAASEDGPQTTPGSSRVAVQLRGADKESYSVFTESPGWLVVAGMWDPGWQAKVNGDKTDVLRANYNLRSVRVPAGRSHVEFEYRPRGFEFGIAISVATLLAGTLLVTVSSNRRQRAASTRSHGEGDV